MLQVMELRVILGRFVIFSFLLSLSAYYAITQWAYPEWPIYKIATVLSFVTPILIAIFTSKKVWRPAWKILTILDSSTYPDLNGIWEGKIEPSPTEDGTTTPTIQVKARIVQTMFEIFIDFHGETFTSITLAATPRIEQGQHYLYYVYRSESRDPRRPPFEGTTKLRIQATGSGKNQCLSLWGKYFTRRPTTGAIVLTRISSNPDPDISFHQYDPVVSEGVQQKPDETGAKPSSEGVQNDSGTGVKELVPEKEVKESK